jgi:alpha-1,6-mannosyltransferase
MPTAPRIQPLSLAAPEATIGARAVPSTAFGPSSWPVTRPDARCAVADVTEWFGETSGGIRTYLLEKGRYISARPWLRHALVVPGARDDVSTADGVTHYRLRGPRIPRQHPYRFMFAIRTLRAIIAHERPHVIEVGSPLLTPWLMRRVGREFDIPMVAFYHTSLPRLVGTGPSMARAITRQALLSYVRLLHGPLPLTIACSHFALDDLARAGVERVAYLPLGVDLDRFSPRGPAERAATRLRLGLPLDVPVAAYVGRFATEKAIDVVLDAWARVHARTGALLLLVGAGPVEPLLRAHPAAPFVRFVPFVRDRQALSELLSAIDLQIAPGPVETFGLAALEGLASGTPVLCVDRGAVAELVTASTAGAVYPFGDSGALGEIAVELLQQDLVSIGARGRAYAEHAHAWPRVFDRLFALYEEVARGR